MISPQGRVPLNLIILHLPLLLLLVFSNNALAAYQPYYTDSLTSANSNWSYANIGNLSFTSSGLTSSTTNGGFAISIIAVPDGTYDYEVNSIIRLSASGGTYVQYLRATYDAVSGPVSAGTYYAVELQNPTVGGPTWPATLSVYKRVGGVVSLLGTTQVTCQDGMPMRSVIRGQQLIVYSSGHWLFTFTDSSISTGKPGIGVRGAPSSNKISRADLGPLDRIAPEAVNAQSVATSVQPSIVDFQWQGVLDDANGTGVIFYEIQRNGSLFMQSRYTEFTDPTVSPSTNYNYTIAAVDYHGGVSTLLGVNVTTPATGTIDPRRTGFGTTGIYWGGMGEEIDLMSGNLNFSLPLITAHGRGGAKLPLGLSYNSQQWRNDAGGLWKLGRDVGHGFGWKLQVGSLAAQFSDYWTLHHWTFTDATGAEYRLDVDNGNYIWTSREGIYLRYDANWMKLYFPDGSFWVMDARSTGAEEDAGMIYPSVVQGSNGNLIRLRYQAGNGVAWENSSARIKEVEDVRAVLVGSTYRTYTFGYSAEARPHLTSITSHIGDGQNYSFSYLPSQSLSSPFAPQQAFGTTHLLQTSTVTGLNLQHNFEYLTNGSGELSKVTFPHGGHLRWSYRDFTFLGQRTWREVETRYLKPSAPAAEEAYTLERDAGDSSYSNHRYAWLTDPNGRQKYYAFHATLGDWKMGLLSSFEQRPAASQPATQRQDYTWVQDSAGNPYVRDVVTTVDPGTPQSSQVRKSQWRDANGNVTRSEVTDWNDVVNPIRSVDYTYLSTSAYTSRFIYDRLLTATATGGSQTVQVVQNTYDQYPQNTLIAAGPMLEHDSSTYHQTFLTRGNLTTSARPGQTINWKYDITGTVRETNDGQGHLVTVTPDSGKNYAVPSVITPNNTAALAVSFTYDPVLHVITQTAPNSATSQATYDSYGRVQSTQDAHGVVTNYAYTYNPSTQTATNVDGRFAKTTLDGLGRAIRVETGDTGGVKSIVDTEYSPCACSPLGKVQRVSQPYASAETPVWTTYSYDVLGRTTSISFPGGSGTTTYLYEGNTTTVTDATGKWKKYTADTLGNLRMVEEPQIGGPNLETIYNYDVMNHLTTVSMTRVSTTQTRTFAYDTNQRLQSATLPESGTSTYTYNADGTPATRTDAKGQRSEFSYDVQQRVTQVRQYLSSGAEDVCQRVNFYYDSNPFDAALSANPMGRPTAKQWFVSKDGTCTNGYKMTETFSYTSGGLLAQRRLYAKTETTWPAFATSLGSSRNLTYTYDSYARLWKVQYPDGRLYTHAFDSQWRPIQLSDPSSTLLVNEVGYNAASQISSMKNFAGLSGPSQPAYYSETRTYNL